MRVIDPTRAVSPDVPADPGTEMKKPGSRTSPQLGAVVMASGDSVRFEAGNKLLALYQGKPLLAWVLAALPEADFARRLVVTRSQEIAALAQGMGFEALLHSLPALSDTVRLGTQAMAAMDGCLFAVGDQPLLTADTVRRLAALFAQHPDHIVRASAKGKAGNPVIFPRRFFQALCTLPAGQGGSAVIRRWPEAVLTAEAGDERELRDIDTQREYEALQAIAGKDGERT